MIYPKNFEEKIGFDEIKQQLSKFCLCRLGQERVTTLSFSCQSEDINENLEEVRELRSLLEKEEQFPLDGFLDLRQAIQRIHIQNTHLEEDELFALEKLLKTESLILKFVRSRDDDQGKKQETGTDCPGTTYPALYELADGVADFPKIIQRIQQIIDEDGHLRDNASPELHDIRSSLKRARGSITKTLYGILRSAQSEGVVDKDISPTMRDGSLVIPVAPSLKRRIRGIVHDESATGKTVFIEPEEVVDANNKVRELEGKERQEEIRILKEVTTLIRPYVRELLDVCRFMGDIDLIYAKVALARSMKASEPKVEDQPVIDWVQARHPLLEKTLKEKENGSHQLVPLDIILKKDARILVISGPNAGGKSVCLKTVGLLQYMLQCGLPIPVAENSHAGIFQDIMIDIGDEQSLENDLSTYSSHLLHMKNMMKQANEHTLFLIDEFGSGTEPRIGGAIAECVLNQLLEKGAWGVVTTHYSNLKHFADSHQEVVNGAMLYDRHEMRPLFQLAIGRPGSSFAVDIARKIGLPENVIREASEIVGNDYIQSDKYLQDIVRDKRYWESKRQQIHQKEKEVEKESARYEESLSDVEEKRREILEKAKDEARSLLAESNKKIENAIKTIRESQAQKEITRQARQELDHFKQKVDSEQKNEDAIALKIEKIKQRRERREKHKAERAKNLELQKSHRTGTVTLAHPELAIGDPVRIKGMNQTGKIVSLNGKGARVVFGDMLTTVDKSKLEYVPILPDARMEKQNDTTRQEAIADRLRNESVSQTTQSTIDTHRSQFHQDLDVRGMRGDEALNTVQHFIDDAILMNVPRVRILHGKGTGILRDLIRQYLATIPNVTHFSDENVQFGGAGITVVDF
ncbi:MAG: Smr/MutS family protein [Prevotella sp.]|jgi:DNA mismatch repair protein MutS2|nr:Smr/MutS family protein [Prevotella sp.]MCH4185403.1 Smr/MutS family protein [Prevotella sp.]MCH4215647.1 Smr/MutS family protein [Prevotella sp.]MCH4250944.1 Smr/MutS family protein [Prevotella sp.]MCI1370981.1 Smr/MutS family protein [Prevotella sp.]